MTYLISLLEKTVSTYVQAFITALLVGQTIDISTAQAAALASIPAGLTIIANGLPVVPQGLPFYVDLVGRTIRTYVVSFIGFLVALPVFELNYSILAAASSAALPAALAVIKGALASRVGSHTPAAVPARFDDATPEAA